MRKKQTDSNRFLNMRSQPAPSDCPHLALLNFFLNLRSEPSSGSSFVSLFGPGNRWTEADDARKYLLPLMGVLNTHRWFTSNKTSEAMYHSLHGCLKFEIFSLKNQITSGL